MATPEPAPPLLVAPSRTMDAVGPLLDRADAGIPLEGIATKTIVLVNPPSDALAAYEAHRAVDTVMRAVNHYILGERAKARTVLSEASLRTLAASDRIQRARMLTLALALHFLVRLPRMSVVARVFERRWHGRGPLHLRQS